jgi:predicted nucleic acid-binding protein
MRVVADTGPLLAAVNRRDEAHQLAAELITRLGRNLVVPAAVLVEVDHLARARVGDHAARLFLGDIAAGVHRVAYTTPGLLKRAVDIDARHADVRLGLVDAVVMAVAEQHDNAVLTFDFTDFRAVSPGSGAWRMVVDEARYRDAVGG